MTTQIPNCNRDCDCCEAVMTCPNPEAAAERELMATPERRGDPRICDECMCHDGHGHRIAELEQTVSRIEGLLFGLAAFFERAGAGDD
jgi:hypothetical protein